MHTRVCPGLPARLTDRSPGVAAGVDLLPSPAGACGLCLYLPPSILLFFCIEFSPAWLLPSLPVSLFVFCLCFFLFLSPSLLLPLFLSLSLSHPHTHTHTPTHTHTHPSPASRSFTFTPNSPTRRTDSSSTRSLLVLRFSKRPEGRREENLRAQTGGAETPPRRCSLGGGPASNLLIVP